MALSQHIAWPPISLQELLVDEGGTDTVVYRAPCSHYFRTDSKIFPSTGFLAELLQHLPEPRSRLIRGHGLYCSRGRSTWPRTSHLVRLAPQGWQRDHPPSLSSGFGLPDVQQSDCSVSAKQRRAAWARLIKKVYAVDPLTCPRCRQPMKVLAVITDPKVVFKILRHLITIAKPPPGLVPASLN